MAAPSEEENPVKRKTSKLPPEIDLTSPRFDAAKALFSMHVILPFSSAQPLDNIAKFESWSRPTKKSEESSVSRLQIKPAKKQPQRPIPARPYHRKNEQQTDVDLSKPSGRPRDRLSRNVLTRMNAYKKGPLSFLRECVENHHVVKIWTRSACELRGFCTGYLVAFDKYFNLAVMDVDETYRKPVSRDNRIPQHSQTKLPLFDSDGEKENSAKDSTEAPQESSIIASVESSVNAMENLKITNTGKSKETSDIKNVCTHSITSCVSGNTVSGPESQMPENTNQTVEHNDGEGKDDTTDQKNKDIKSTVRTKNTTVCSEETLKNKKDKTLPSFDGASVAKVWQEAVAKDKSKPPLKLKHRHANQLFIRGDNVVSISLVYK
ncbi:U7 snRNA-associated Sm-like protein LSm11 [Argopecten irradians]|uniref:U7 snRNA-associated Sm-like protein LSm11 n=1 Tax=Argopecten irradians TaxID=31199 RepID=UPI0037118BFD